MTNIVSQSDNSPFDAIRQVDDQNNEFWYGRELMQLLGYQKWERFNNVVLTAQENLEDLVSEVSSHVSPVWEASGKTKRLNYKLSRLACYHVALCCDSRGNDSVKLAKHYFAIKTREAELAPQQVSRVLPTRDAVDYIEAAAKLDSLSEGILKHLLKDALVDQVSLEQNLKYLPFADKPKQYTIAKVRAKSLGYSDMQIGDGSQLGRFIKSQIEPAFQEQVGRYPVFHYEITGDLDTAIHRYFNR
jgi:DNA-damage-inducible protein D